MKNILFFEMSSDDCFFLQFVIYFEIPTNLKQYCSFHKMLSSQLVLKQLVMTAFIHTNNIGKSNFTD